MINIFRDKILIDGLAKEQKILNNKLINSLFQDIPKLRSIGFSKSNEYDDNNYYDSAKVDYINGIELDGEDYYIENGKVFLSADGEETANEDDVLDNDSLGQVVSTVNQYAESGDNYGEYTLTREEFKNIDFNENIVFRTYYQSYLSGERVENESLFSKDINIAICYAFDVLKGRLSKEVEKSLEKEFKKDIFLSYIYAIYCIKGRLPKNVDNYFTLKSFKELNDFEKKYINLYKEFVNSNVAQKV